MDRLACMASFARVVEKGSFAAAAEGTGLTATMIGNHVRFLEARLGARLLNRTTRRQSLTELGRGYHERCKHILAEVDAAEAQAADLRAAPRGLLRLTAPVALGASVLPRLLAEYLRRQPQVEVELALNDRVVDLLEEGFEAAIRVGALVDSRLIALPLMPYRVVLCAAPGYLRERGVPLAPGDLAGHSCLDFTLSGLHGAWRLGNGETVAPRGRLRANNGQALRAAALEGLGIALLPQLLVDEDLAAGRLIRVLPDHAPPGRHMHLLTLPDRRPTPKLRSFVAFMTRRLGVAPGSGRASDRRPAIGEDVLPRDPSRVLAGEERHNASDVLGVADPAEG